MAEVVVRWRWEWGAWSRKYRGSSGNCNSAPRLRLIVEDTQTERVHVAPGSVRQTDSDSLR